MRDNLPISDRITINPAYGGAMDRDVVDKIKWFTLYPSISNMETLL